MMMRPRGGLQPSPQRSSSKERAQNRRVRIRKNYATSKRSSSVSAKVVLFVLLGGIAVSVCVSFGVLFHFLHNYNNNNNNAAGAGRVSVGGRSSSSTSETNTKNLQKKKIQDKAVIKNKKEIKNKKRLPWQQQKRNANIVKKKQQHANIRTGRPKQKEKEEKPIILPQEQHQEQHHHSPASNKELHQQEETKKTSDEDATIRKEQEILVDPLLLSQQKDTLKKSDHVIVLPTTPAKDKNDTKEEEMVIDMRVLNYELAFDNPDGGTWKQGWDIDIVSKENLQIFVVPHSHCDPGWIQTFDTYFRTQTSKIITTVIQALLEDKRRTFIWAEISYFSWWYEEQDDGLQKSVKQLLESGQLEFVTGGWVQPDEANSQLYAMEIQLQEGHDWIATHVGAEHIPKYGWAIDPFGYSETAAYLWKKYQFEGMLIQRVHYAVKKELAKHRYLEFYWRQTWDHNVTMTNSNNNNDHQQEVMMIHEHDIFTHVMPFFSYDVPHTCGPDPAVCCQFDFARLPGMKFSCPWHQPPHVIDDENVKERALLLLDQYRKKAALYRSNAVLAPLGDDFRYQTPKEALAQYTNYQKIFDYINENVPGVTIQFGTLSQYFKAARQTFQGPVPVLKGSFFTYADVNQDYWSGYYTSRVFDKALDRQLERVLFAAETMAASSTIRAELQAPRRALSLFQHHDGVTGTAKNHVVEDYAQRIQDAIQLAQDWIIQHAVAEHQDEVKSLFGSDEVVTDEIRPCWVSSEPRQMKHNQCMDDNGDDNESVVLVYNPLETPQSCGTVIVPGHAFARVHLPCEQPGPAVETTSTHRAGNIPPFVFDPHTGLMLEPVREEWNVWSVRGGGAYLFVPGQQRHYEQDQNNLVIEHDGFVVTTNYWKRTVVEKEVPTEFGTTARVIDFIYETELEQPNEEWFVRFSSEIANDGYFHTDLNGFNFDTHRFRKDMPIQSQVFPMPTLASIQDDHSRMSVVSEHAQGTASLQDGSIDVWLDRRLKQDDNRGLGQGVLDNRRTRTRFRVVLEHEAFERRDDEFTITPLGRRMWDELQHPLEMFGRVTNRTVSNKAETARKLTESHENMKGDKARAAAAAAAHLKENIGYRDISNRNFTVENTGIPFVFMVHNRVDYLKASLESLMKSDFPRERVPIIISHDGHVPEMLEYVKTLEDEFQIHQLFHPYSCHDHPDKFPGDEPTLNYGFKGDLYGNPRSWEVTCVKHHFTWLVNAVFSLDKSTFETKADTFLFLEEDYIVAPTIYQALVSGLNAMDEFKDETDGGFLGLSLDPTEGNDEKLPDMDANTWYPAAFVSSPMTLDRSTFSRIQQHAEAFCGYDDYNWDWSFVHMQQQGLIPHTVLLPSQSLVQHIGLRGGLHAHKRRRPDQNTHEDTALVDTRFLGLKLRGNPFVPPRAKKKPNGGWGHRADQDHCMKILTGSIPVASLNQV